MGKVYELAERLWESNIREIRILASMIDNLEVVTEEQMEVWVKGGECSGARLEGASSKNIFRFHPFSRFSYYPYNFEKQFILKFLTYFYFVSLLFLRI